MNKFNPLAYIPVGYRVALYITYGLGGLILIYLQGKGIVGADELTLYIGAGTFLGLTAASNIDVDSKKPSDSQGLGSNSESEDFLF